MPHIGASVHTYYHRNASLLPNSKTYLKPLLVPACGQGLGNTVIMVVLPRSTKMIRFGDSNEDTKDEEKS
jgi:hypothetical protein